MAIEGPLRELAISDVFQLLDLSRKTGVLTVRSEARDRPVLVRFERGAVVGAEFPETSRRLGHLLLRAGKITEGELEMARRHQQSNPGSPLGGVLLELGLVAERDLARQLRFQVEETVFELIRWKDGYFRFEETPSSGNGSQPLRIATESLLMEAARRIDEWTTLEGRIPHIGIVPALVGNTAGEGPTLDLHPSEWEVLAEIDGERTLKAIATELGRGDFEVAKIVYGLVCTGVVEIVDEQPAQPTAPSATAAASEALQEAARLLADGQAAGARRSLEALLRVHRDHPEAHLLLGRALSAMGRAAEAVESLGHAARLDPLSAAAHYHLGFAAARVGDLRRAESAWNTCLRLADGEPRRREIALKAARCVASLRSVLEEEGE
jgi:tetratricopeptide (TPR) repeat protein